MKLIKQVQYKAALIVTSCWQGTSCEKLYDELGRKPLDQCQWGHSMTTWYKIVDGLTPAYLLEHVKLHVPHTVSFLKLRAPIAKTERYQHSFFPHCIDEYNSLKKDVKYAPTLKNSTYLLISPEESFYSANNQYGIKLTQLRV